MTSPALQRALNAIDASNRQSRRVFGADMPREALLKWLTCDSFCQPIQSAARWVQAEPNNPAASDMLMRAIMAQLRRRFRRETRSMRLADTTTHRNVFRAVARIHMEQRAAMLQAAE